MTKKVEKTTLYRLFFEICSVTTFSKNPPCSMTKPPVTPPQCDPCWLPSLLYPRSNIKEENKNIDSALFEIRLRVRVTEKIFNNVLLYIACIVFH